jgi:hypothetical protein
MKKNLHKIILLLFIISILIIKINSNDNISYYHNYYDFSDDDVIDIILKNPNDLNDLNDELKNYIIEEEYYLHLFWNKHVKYVDLPIPNNIIKNQKIITDYIKKPHNKEFFRCFLYASYLNFNSISIYIENMDKDAYIEVFNVGNNHIFFYDIKNTDFYKKIIY